MFLFGVVTGAGLDAFLHPYFFSPPRPEDIQKHMLGFLIYHLNLTPEQQEQIKPITVDFASQTQVLHSQSLNQIAQLAATTDERIKQYLTPEQKVEMDKMTREWEDNFAKHEPPPGGGPPPFGPPPGGPPPGP